MKGLRGIDEHQEQSPSRLIRDTRTLGQKIMDVFRNPAAVCMMIAVLAAASIFICQLADLFLVVGLIVFAISMSQRVSLPFRMPKNSGMLDYNDLKPGSNKPNKARGIYFFGNDKDGQEELWFTNEDMRTHVLIFGSTGSGKTETLVSLAFNALLHGSGFIYVDGKGDNSLFAKIFSMVRYVGREDDLLLVNFMTGARDIIGPQKKRLSNTMNPFAKGSSSMLTQLVVSLMESGSNSGDGDMWKGRAIAFVEALMKILVAMRDAGHILLDANTIRNYFPLDRLEAMVLDKAFIRDGQEAISLEGLPDVILQPITNYLINLPGYNKAKKGKQVSQVLEQHGFITMQLTRAFSSLADTYGHILRTNLAEVDFHDVVLNRRILAVLLPALEKSPDELRNLGKIVISTMKAMMASGLGDEVVGPYRDLITRKPTNSLTPFLCILDEYGYYAVQGFAVVPAQARSLGFSVVFAGQDLPAFQKASKEEAQSIGANTNIKICMKLEDPLETWDFFQKTAGEAYVTSVENFATDGSSMLNQYMDNRSAKVEKRARIDLLDLKDQGLGEMHIFFKSTIVRAKSFFANPKPVPAIRLNEFVKIELPTDQALYDSTQRIHAIQKRAESMAPLSVAVNPSEVLARVFEEAKKNANLPPIDAGVAILLGHGQPSQTASSAGGRPREVQALSLEEGVISIFTPLHISDYLEKIIITKDLKKFSLPILDHEVTVKGLSHIERLLGQPESHAMNVGEELGKDLHVATQYPPKEHEAISASELEANIRVLCQNIVMVKSEAKTE